MEEKESRSFLRKRTEKLFHYDKRGEARFTP
jgi:hypothetical protein